MFFTTGAVVGAVLMHFGGFWCLLLPLLLVAIVIADLVPNAASAAVGKIVMTSPSVAPILSAAAPVTTTAPINAAPAKATPVAEAPRLQAREAPRTTALPQVGITMSGSGEIIVH